MSEGDDEQVFLQQMKAAREFMYDVVRLIPAPQGDDQPNLPQFRFLTRFNQKKKWAKAATTDGDGAGPVPGLKVANRKASGKGGKRKNRKRKLQENSEDNDTKAEPGSTPSPEKNKGQKQHQKQQVTTPGTSKQPLSGECPRTDNGMLFSKFNFATQGDRKGRFAGKDYKNLLKKVEGRKNKIEKLAEKDEKKAQLFAEKVKWEEAIDKSRGVKVKTDEAMLQKALKRKEKSKAQRLKKWDKRTQHTQLMLDRRQEKRTQNIDKVKDKRKDKKIKRSMKKGRVVI